MLRQHYCAICPLVSYKTIFLVNFAKTENFYQSHLVWFTLRYKTQIIMRLIKVSLEAKYITIFFLYIYFFLLYIETFVPDLRTSDSNVWQWKAKPVGIWSKPWSKPWDLEIALEVENDTHDSWISAQSVSWGSTSLSLGFGINIIQKSKW